MKQFNISGVTGLSWEISVPKGFIVISHGMAEHASRYDRFAKVLNKHNYSVFAINQIGHGVPVLGTKGHWDKDDFYHCVDNLKTLIDDIKSKHPTTPVVLFGHSMGSFVAQEFISKHGKSVDAAVLSGSNGPSPLFIGGHVIADVVSLFTKKTKPSKFLNGLSFGSYNKQFEPARTEFDWLSRDTKEVDKYVADPDCGYLCTVGYFKEFLKGLASLHKEEKINAIPKKLPILLISGESDPVGDNSKGVEKLYNLYKDHNIKDVTLKLYHDCRHELLNELNRDEVTEYLINFFDKHI